MRVFTFVKKVPAKWFMMEVNANGFINVTILQLFSWRLCKGGEIQPNSFETGFYCNFCFIRRPALNLTERLAGTLTFSRVLGF